MDVSHVLNLVGVDLWLGARRCW